MNQEYRQLTLSNGLRVIVVPMRDAESITFLKGYHVGSRQETDELSGAAHFIEHLMFKGTVKRPKARDIMRALDAVGAEYNAFTAKDMTAYYIKIAADKAELAADILSDMLYHATFPAEEIERERGVILEEMKMYEDTPTRHIDDVFEQEAYKESSLGRFIIGNRESIYKMTRDQLLEYKNSFYTDDQSVLVVAGKVPDNIDELLERYFNVRHEANGAFALHAKETVFTLSEPRVRVLKKTVEQIHLQLGYRCKGFTDDDSYVHSVISTHLGGGMSSVLFDEVREQRGLCYYIRMYPDLYEDVGNIVVRAGLNKEKIADALEVIQNILQDFARNGMTDEELQQAKDQIIGGLKLSLEDSANRAELYLKRYLLAGEIMSPQDRIDRVQAVTKDDILRVSQEIFRTSNATLAVIADDDTIPFKNFLR